MFQLVSDYFATSNPFVPLFHQPTYLKMLQDWYAHPAHRTTVAWAAINIVVVLARRYTFEGRLQGIKDEMAAACLKRVQSVISDLVARTEDLLGIQVLVGMVMHFQGTTDPQPASVLIGTAIRLAHRLQLHSEETHQYFTEDEKTQRSRVFWISYYLDKV